MKRNGILTLCICLLAVIIVCLPAKKADAAGRKPRLNLTELNLVHKDTYTLRVYNTKKNQRLTFKCSNKKIASLTQRNSKKRTVLVRGRKPGIATITITVKQKRKIITRLICRVNVTPPAVSIIFREKRIRLKVGDTFKAVPIIKPNITSEVPNFFSSDETVATVNLRGRVTALAPGHVYISAILSSGQRAYYIIEVSDEEPQPKIPKKNMKDNLITHETNFETQY